MRHSKAIGIVGGVGPYAGLDLNRKIFDNTVAKTDQEHLQVILFSFSADIPDRTKFLFRGFHEFPS
jgi:aspartate racemase